MQGLSRLGHKWCDCTHTFESAFKKHPCRLPSQRCLICPLFLKWWVVAAWRLSQTCSVKHTWLKHRNPKDSLVYTVYHPSASPSLQQFWFYSLLWSEHKTFYVSTYNFLEDFVLQMNSLEALRFFPPNLHHQLQTFASRYAFSSTGLFTALVEAEAFLFPVYYEAILEKSFLANKMCNEATRQLFAMAFFLHRFFYLLFSFQPGKI